MKHKKNLQWIIIGILFLIIFLYFILHKKINSVSPTQTQNYIATVSNTQKSTPTAVGATTTVTLLQTASTTNEQSNATPFTSSIQQNTQTPFVVPANYYNVSEHNFSNETHRWSSIAFSKDGTKIAAVSGLSNLDDGYVYISSDSGKTWTQQFGGVNYQFTNIVSSADGNTLVVARMPTISTCNTSHDCFVYVSTDGGATWSKKSNGDLFIWQIAMSLDGNTIIAKSADTQEIIVSTDNGNTWSKKSIPGVSNLGPVIISGDGNHIIATDLGKTTKGLFQGGYLYTSSNNGNTWTKITTAGTHFWGYIASSFDGTKLTFIEPKQGAIHSNPFGSDSEWPGDIYTSSNSGSTWTKTNAGAKYWSALASSSDGQELIASVMSGDIYVSTDEGKTWVDKTLSSNTYWFGVGISPDGTKFGAINSGKNNSSIGTIWLN